MCIMKVCYLDVNELLSHVLHSFNNKFVYLIRNIAKVSIHKRVLRYNEQGYEDNKYP